MNLRLSSILASIFFVIGISSCLDSEEISVDDPRGTLEEYIELNDVSDYMITESGLYYQALGIGQNTEPMRSTDVVDYRIALYTMNGDLIYDGFDDDEELWVTSLEEDAFAIEGVQEALLSSNVEDSLSLLIPSELAYGSSGIDGFVNPNEDLRVIVKAENVRLTPLDYVEENDIDYLSTSSGLFYTFENTGEGNLPTVGQTVEVHYTGYLFDGTKFDSSVDRGVTFSFTLGAGQVISGWDEGIALFRKGQKGTLYLPYYLGYGINGAGTDILPYDNLIFEVELIDIF